MTNSVITFPKHKLSKGYCELCKGSGDTLPTDCPGVPMGLVQQLAVKHDSVDFVNGKWVFTS